MLLYVCREFLLFRLGDFEERYLSDPCFDLDEQDTIGKLLICSFRTDSPKSYWCYKIIDERHIDAQRSKIMLK